MKESKLFVQLSQPLQPTF